MPAIVALIPIFLTACTLRLFNPLESEWKALNEAESVSCDRWPMQVTDLSLDDIRVIPGATGDHGFFIKATTRKGEKKFYTGMFPDSYTVSQKHQNPLNADPGNTWAGTGGGLWASLTEAEEQEGVVEGTLILTIRSLKSGQAVKMNMSGATDKVYLSGTSEGRWLITQTDNVYQLAFLNASAELEKPPVMVNIATNFSERPFAFGSPDQGNAWTLMPVESEAAPPPAAADSNGESEFQAGGVSVGFEWRQILAGGKAGPAVKLPLPGNQGVEGWAAETVKDGFALAYVDGDSLVGDSRLNLVWVDLAQKKPVVKWQKSFELENIHVGDPAFTRTGDSLRLHLLQWVDAESTLASWVISESGVKEHPRRGVFPEGSTLMDTMVDRKTSVAYALVRFREELNWQFDLCELR